MTLSDLKTGMIVTLRDGTERIVFLGAVSRHSYTEENIIVSPSGDGWSRLCNYEEDFKSTVTSNYDIVKVELAPHPYAFTDINYSRSKRKVLWQEEKIKEVTMSEIEEKFGCKVKIVKENGE